VGNPATPGHDSDLRALPPSAKYVLKVLNYEGELTQGDLVDETGLPRRTVRDAARILEDHGHISSRYGYRDARTVVYAPVTEI